MRHPAYQQFILSPLNGGWEARDGVICRTQHHRTKVAIVGAGVGRSVALLDDPGWEVWALNLIVPRDVRGRLRADLWFDLHQAKAQSEHDMKWIANCPVPIMVPEDLVWAGPNCAKFPIEDLLNRYGVGNFSCTFAYQIAWAMSLGFTDIGLFGIELRYGTMRERTVEWASVSWWLGFAQARGVKIWVPRGSWLTSRPHLYGFEYDEEIQDVNEYVATMKALDGEAMAAIDGPKESE